MPKFRKKPVVIEAIQWTGINMQEMLAWFAQIIQKPITTVAHENVEFETAKCKVTFDMTQKPAIKLLIKTLEGTHEASHGDWVICGVRSELYPCKDSIFKETYEPA
jgi:hypothetical protein